MTTVNRFEDLDAWKKARHVANAIYALTKRRDLRADWVLSKQLSKSAVSIMSNLAEGFARRGDREFASFLSIAHGSVAELQSQLYLAIDQGYILEPEFQALYDELTEVSKMIHSVARYLRGSWR